MKKMVVVLIALFSTLSFASAHFSSCGQRGKHGETPKYVILDEKPAIENLLQIIKSNKSQQEKKDELGLLLQGVANENGPNAFCPMLVQSLKSTGAGYLEKCKKALVEMENFEGGDVSDITDLTMFSCQFSLATELAIQGF
jgi:hypothetical protein